MNSFYYDLILSGLTYVLLTYLAFTLMRRRKRPQDGNDEGGTTIESGPTLDLPPGVVWPNGPDNRISKNNKSEELVY